LPCERSIRMCNVLSCKLFIRLPCELINGRHHRLCYRLRNALCPCCREDNNQDTAI
jgi:hypothetical protein